MTPARSLISIVRRAGIIYCNPVGIDESSYSVAAHGLDGGRYSRIFPMSHLVTKWIDNGTLQHPLDWARPGRRMGVLQHRTVTDGSRGQGLPVYCNRIIHEELDPNGGKTGGRQGQSKARQHRRPGSRGA